MNYILYTEFVKSGTIRPAAEYLSVLQEHVCTAECGEGGAVARVPDRARAHVQQVQEEDGQEVPGGGTVRHVHLQQVSTVLYVSQMKLSWKLPKICKEISLNGQSTYVDTVSTLISPYVLPVFLLLAGPLRKCPPVPSSIIRPYHSAASHPTLLHHHTLPFCIITPYTLLHHHTLPSCITTLTVAVVLQGNGNGSLHRSHGLCPRYLDWTGAQESQR